MGSEARCEARVDGRADLGEAHLEPAELRFHGSSGRVVVPAAEVRSATARGGWLDVAWQGGRLELQLGASAEAWALKIRYPKPVIDKLGVKPGHRVSVLGLAVDAPFRAEVAARAGKVSWGRLVARNDLVFLAIAAGAELARLPALRQAIAPDGAIWVLWPKGRKELREDDVRAKALACGLVDVKVVAFSETLSALKLVIPLSQRPRPAGARAGKTKGKSKR